MELRRAGLADCLLGRLLSGGQMGECWALWPHCGSRCELPCEFSLHCPTKKKKCPPHTHTEVVAPPVWISLAKFWIRSLGTVPWARRVALSRDIQSVRLLEAIIWDQEEGLTPLCRPTSSPMETLDLPLPASRPAQGS